MSLPTGYRLDEGLQRWILKHCDTGCSKYALQDDLFENCAALYLDGHLEDYDGDGYKLTPKGRKEIR